MTKRKLLTIGAGVFGIAAACGATWFASLPAQRAVPPPRPIAADEHARTVAALKPPKRKRPVIAIIGINDATEVTDYLMPYGILRRADVAEVSLLATGEGPVRLFPALKVQPQATTAAFDRNYPAGADYVIVPQMSRPDDPAALAWIKAQAAKGAIVIGVCAGARVVARTGLLDGRRATTHWYYLREMLQRHPSIRYVPNRRMVVDGKVATTTGISASIPMALTLIEAIAGRGRAQATARAIGVPTWDARHASAAFRFDRPFALTVAGNVAALWNRERLGIALTPGIDEVSLALAADAWSRTYRSRAITFAPGGRTVTSAGGVAIYPDEAVARWPAETRLPAIAHRPPGQVLDETLADIRRRYGAPTARVVAMQLEYRRGG